MENQVDELKWKQLNEGIKLMTQEQLFALADSKGLGISRGLGVSHTFYEIASALKDELQSVENPLDLLDANGRL